VTAVVLAVRFACELAALVAVAWWLWLVPGVVLALVVAAVWGIWIAPKSSHRLPDPARLVLELAIFTVATHAYLKVGRPVVAVVFALLAVATALLSRSGTRFPRLGNRFRA
jgi:hypothetical protein